MNLAYYLYREKGWEPSRILQMDAGERALVEAMAVYEAAHPEPPALVLPVKPRE